MAAEWMCHQGQMFYAQGCDPDMKRAEAKARAADALAKAVEEWQEAEKALSEGCVQAKAWAAASLIVNREKAEANVLSALSAYRRAGGGK